MLKSAFFLSLIAVVFGPVALMAQGYSAAARRGEEPPPIVLTGLQAYKDHGPDEAVRAWIKGGPMEGSRQVLVQANNLRDVQEIYGGYRWFDVVSVRSIASRTRIVYLVLNFERGPVFAKFNTYRSEQGWIVVSFEFNTKENIVFPPEVLFPGEISVPVQP